MSKMLIDRALLEQALEALGMIAGAMPFPAGRSAIEALRAALMEPVVVQEQEELVTRRSASAALDYLSLHNGPGRLAEATKMLVHSPRREWQGLSEEEREQATGWSVEHIEAALKEKNK